MNENFVSIPTITTWVVSFKDGAGNLVEREFFTKASPQIRGYIMSLDDRKIEYTITEKKTTA